MYFLIGVICLGVFGAFSDICLSLWAQRMTFGWWTISAILFLIFMSGLGLVMRHAPKEYSLTMIVVIVLLSNVLGVWIWDLIKGIQITTMQGLGVVFAIAAIICFEIKN